ncbi:hypothetical protein AK88_05246 [Plasmodium fragile]|uniref:Uncharacterized protein n=1 Tax=Plasmodium fragile TaxID=5857 RepID=A0A0D9QHE8_PLAFR|nr:uncharacterized protein AK88_05246 [Plasmodium fragile]KJP85121.1 hypothetical protein AK88_05246 [Plasmodium fragile]
MGEANVETLPPENNTLLEEKFMGSVNTNGETYLQDRSDVTKYNDSSNSRSRKSSPRASSRKKSKSTMDHINVDKSNESLNLNNFDEDEGTVKFGGSMRFSSMESVLEGRSDHGNDVDQGFSSSMLFDSMDSIFEKGADDIFNNKDKVHKSANADSMESIFQEGANNDDSNRSQEITESMTFDSTGSLFEKRDDDNLEEKNRMAESSEYHNKDKPLSTTAGLDVDDAVCYYIDKLQQQNKFSASPSRGLFKNTMLGKMFRKIFPTLRSEIRRHLNMQAYEKYNCSVREVNGTREFFNVLRKYRAFAPLVVFGILSPLLLISLIKMSSSIMHAMLILLPWPYALIIALPFVVKTYILPFIAIALLCGGYGFLLFYSVSKLFKVKRSSKHIDGGIMNRLYKIIKSH